MDERGQRIVEAAIMMAEEDGYDAVRLRDLAEKANVALGTVYRRFSCKEDILAAALEQQVAELRKQISDPTLLGTSPEERLRTFFSLATTILSHRPKLAAAMLRTVASGVPELSEKVMRYHGEMTEIILAIYRGGFSEDLPTEREHVIAALLQNIWFGALVGWTGGLHGPEIVTEQMSAATRLLLRGDCSTRGLRHRCTSS